MSRMMLDFRHWQDAFEANWSNTIGEKALKEMKVLAKTFFEKREVCRGLSRLIGMGWQSDFINKESLWESLRDMESLADSPLDWLDILYFSAKHGYNEVKHSALVNICQAIGMGDQTRAIENSRNGDFLTSVLRDLVGKVKFFSLDDKIAFLSFFKRAEEILEKERIRLNLLNFPEGKFPSQFIEESILESLKKT